MMHPMLADGDRNTDRLTIGGTVAVEAWVVEVAEELVDADVDAVLDVEELLVTVTVLTELEPQPASADDSPIAIRTVLRSTTRAYPRGVRIATCGEV